MWYPVCCGKGDGNITAAVSAVGSCPCQRDHGTFCHPFQLPFIQRNISCNEDDHRAFILSVTGTRLRGIIMDTSYDKISGLPEICHNQRTDHVWPSVNLYCPRRRAYSSLQSKTDHPCPAAYSAFFKICRSAVQSFPDMVLCDMHAADIIQPPVVAFCYNAVHCPRRDTDILILLQHIFCQDCMGNTCTEGIGHQNRSFDGSKLLHLYQSHAFSKTIDHSNTCHDFISEQIPTMGKHSSNPCMDLSLIYGGMPHRYPFHVTDEIFGAMGPF